MRVPGNFKTPRGHSKGVQGFPRLSKGAQGLPGAPEALQRSPTTLQGLPYASGDARRLPGAFQPLPSACQAFCNGLYGFHDLSRFQAEPRGLQRHSKTAQGLPMGSRHDANSSSKGCQPTTANGGERRANRYKNPTFPLVCGHRAQIWTSFRGIGIFAGLEQGCRLTPKLDVQRIWGDGQQCRASVVRPTPPAALGSARGCSESHCGGVPSASMDFVAARLVMVLLVGPWAQPPRSTRSGCSRILAGWGSPWVAMSAAL